MSAKHDAKEEFEEELLPRTMSPSEKDATIRSTVASMALSGLDISYEDVAKALEQALKEPVKRLV